MIKRKVDGVNLLTTINESYACNRTDVRLRREI